MKRFVKILASLLSRALCLILLMACSPTPPPEPIEVGSSQDLATHSAEFTQEIVKVTDGPYVVVAVTGTRGAENGKSRKIGGTMVPSRIRVPGFRSVRK